MLLLSLTGREEKVPLASDTHVEDKVDDEEHRGPVQARRIYFRGSAVGAEARQECQEKGDDIEPIHYAEVPFGTSFRDLSWRARHDSQNFIETKEAEVVRSKDKDPVSSDILRP